ncbi:TlpA family protein disulfide reductase [Nocardia otitidiscaviarum]|uniref:TlpA family protein disulfide reductase n=1 Tax=Nocardia otitidiscaviarum TaxID=1823 RepID=UPI001895ECDD|nr:TlpA disulfide reductase family protein [Nocardia otitidiscaviarum]MBF6238268.1 TlpA family protein disulfide reductase [Nocardia otitidiscaviarum]
MSHRPVLRWGLLAVVVAVALTVALWPRDASDDTTAEDGATRPVPVVSEQDRAAAALAACPRPGGAPVGDGPLRGITLTCLADGQPVDLAAALAGKPALLNLWAYWCGPCAEELPLLQQFSDRAAGAVTVLTVHSDPDAVKALARLTDLGVHLPGVADADARVRVAVGTGPYYPQSVLLRADGTVADIVRRTFTSVDDIAATVDAQLGVQA